MGEKLVFPEEVGVARAVSVPPPPRGGLGVRLAEGEDKAEEEMRGLREAEGEPVPLGLLTLLKVATGGEGDPVPEGRGVLDTLALAEEDLDACRVGCAVEDRLSSPTRLCVARGESESPGEEVWPEEAVGRADGDLPEVVDTEAVRETRAVPESAEVALAAAESLVQLLGEAVTLPEVLRKEVGVLPGVAEAWTLAVAGEPVGVLETQRDRVGVTDTVTVEGAVRVTRALGDAAPVAVAAVEEVEVAHEVSEADRVPVPLPHALGKPLGLRFDVPLREPLELPLDVPHLPSPAEVAVGARPVSVPLEVTVAATEDVGVSRAVWERAAEVVKVPPALVLMLADTVPVRVPAALKLLAALLLAQFVMLAREVSDGDAVAAVEAVGGATVPLRTPVLVLSMLGAPEALMQVVGETEGEAEAVEGRDIVALEEDCALGVEPAEPLMTAVEEMLTVEVGEEDALGENAAERELPALGLGVGEEVPVGKARVALGRGLADVAVEGVSPGESER